MEPESVDYIKQFEEEEERHKEDERRAKEDFERRLREENKAKEVRGKLSYSPQSIITYPTRDPSQSIRARNFTGSRPLALTILGGNFKVSPLNRANYRWKFYSL